MKVSQTGTDVYIQVKIRNLVNTFGNAFGAQLLDLYVRNPAATSSLDRGRVPAAELLDRPQLAPGASGSRPRVSRRRSG